jgi:membrane protease YdiL (CAAX protease family)
MSLEPDKPADVLAKSPYEPPVAAEVVGGPHIGALPAKAARPRIWTVFVSVLVTLAAMIGAQVVVIVPIMVSMAAEGVSPKDFETKLLKLVTRPDVFILLGLASQAPIALVALAAGWMSPVPLRQRLGLVRGTASAIELVAMLAGAVVPFGIGIAMAHALTKVLPPDPSIAALYENMTAAMAVPFILFIALAPGFSEELLFRGYVQRRLLQRWPAWAAILVASLIFAAVHIQPHTVAFAFPVGIWLGLMAWKSGAVWPGMICHALINGLWNVWQVGGALGYWPEEPATWALVLVGLIGVVGCAAAIWLMLRPAEYKPIASASV